MNTEQLHTLFLKHPSVSTDTRKIAKDDLYFALKGDNFNGNAFTKQAIENGASYCIVDEKECATSNQCILVEDVLQTLQDLASFHRKYLKLPIIALTGSNGKTTTKELINAVLSKKYNSSATIGNLNNHIGVPLTLLKMTKDTEIGIVEMGANHPKEIEFLCNIAFPDYGLITNFGKAHLEGFGSIEGVIEAKSELYLHLIKHKKIIFVNSNDPIQLEKSKGARTLSFGKNKTDDFIIHFKSAQPEVTITYNKNEINSQLIGEYNFNNISAAVALGTYFKVNDQQIKSAIENYVPKNNRSQIVKKGNIKIILDAYNANPSSMTVALENFGKLETENKIAILGDMFELGQDAKKEHQAIAEFANSLNISKVIFIGENFHESISKTNETYSSFNDFKTHFNLNTLKHATLLIKGSRGMALERILDLLE
ncbi:UDP-N-acetylmuramoyl-tripeptide--D-alanyl-D-alanine ligase [Xanthomarina sp. F2636L]|uniref:UDP-N-acetylmuramoyl-tripeptide--D-alanyl-D- alanine ligase n=1 Tax=Xanthomarina sp. F2636L TaxID=2996018 RepID=UPI00225DD19A|nr:UDP-N-acetylmuramoyl-tripeptide--D-alanyl-D-alanine ligase [Xanthomarina sp. F2636L]MCX7551921.1 UDP-N-acetylmuramoyl-tripeptide--D-alanyl-D-alanine ligase [Xanthomarina sp. F2636L]